MMAHKTPTRFAAQARQKGFHMVAKGAGAKSATAKDEAPKRLNRTAALGEALGSALDPVLKRRGFATRDILTHWAAMAPPPYDKATRPDKLAWPRSEDGAGGAVLHLACAEAHKLGLAHEGAQVAASINRYFGYLLVREVRITVVHEIAHHFGIDDRRLHELGYG